MVDSISSTGIMGSAAVKKTILFVGGGLETIPGIHLAQEMGLHVVVSDMDPDAPCMRIADHKLVADTYSIEETVEQASRFHQQVRPIDGVICMATDVPLTVAAVAEQLGLPGLSVESARLVSDKLLMKDCFAADGLPIPWYQQVTDLEDLRSVVEQRGLPLVIKPVDSRGARGVLRLTEGVDLEWAYRTAHGYSPSGRVMVEAYLPGPQVSTESLVVDGVVHHVGFSDRNYEFLERYAPHIIENGGDLPSYLPMAEQQKISDVVTRAAQSLGMHNGVIKGDMVLTDGEPYVIEVAGRLSGGYFCSHEIPLNTGVDFVGNAIRLVVGDPVDAEALVAKKNGYVCQRYLFPDTGKVEKVHVPAWIEEHRGVKLFELRVKVGDVVQKATHHPARAGVVIVEAASRAEAMALAQRVVDEVEMICS